MASNWTGRKHTEQSRQKMSVSATGRVPWNKGLVGVQVPWNKGKKYGSGRKKRTKCVDCSNVIANIYAKRCQTCFYKYRIRENHPNWIADRTKLAKKQERNDTAYKEWRSLVWKRDGYKCMIANQDCSGRIEAHHILSWSEYPELHYEVNNGITLCHAHHPRRRAEEKRLSTYFMEIVSASKY
jgi:hypothetical protein